MQFAPAQLRWTIKRCLAFILLSVCSGIFAHAQGRFNEGPVQVTTGINLGPDPLAQFDLRQLQLDQMNRHAKESEQRRKQDKSLIDSGMVSALDLQAPNKAVVEYNRATSLMREQNSKRRSNTSKKPFRSILISFPLTSALGSPTSSRRTLPMPEANLKRLESWTRSSHHHSSNLGLLALSRNDFAETAQPELQKAAALRPTDARIPLESGVRAKRCP